MTSLYTSRIIPFQVALLAILMLAFAGFLVPNTTHALPPNGAEIDDGGGGGDGGGGTEPGAGGGTPTVNIVASPSSIESGYSSQLAFSSSYVTRCVIDNGIGEVAVNRSDTRVVSPTQTTTYRISCYSSTQTFIDETTVTVVPAPTPLTAYCEAGPDTAQINETVQWSSTHSSGSTSNLAWKRGNSFTTKVCTGGQNYSEPNRTCADDLADGDSCTVEGQRCRQSSGCDGSTYTDGEGRSNAHTQYGSVTPYTCVASGSSATYTYAWTGTDGLSGSTQNVSKAYATAGEKTGRATVTQSSGGSASATCTANITPKTPTATLSATPNSILSGSSSTLNWSSTNANACTLNESIGAVSTSGSRAVTPGSTTTYTLVCTAPESATSGTWRYYDEDYTDYSCPLENTNKAYSNLPNCPANPDGKACTGSSLCKVNTLSGHQCTIHTVLYQCAGSGSSPAQNATASATVTVGAAPDLTAGSITPTTATAGAAQTFSATISNIGGGNAGASATRFQHATAADGTGATNITDVSTEAISASGSTVKSAAHTFPSAGTFYVRACADMGFAVAESNEGNNCGAWTAVTVASAATPTVSCTVSPTSVAPGGSVTYNANPAGGAVAPFTWTASDGASVGTAATANRTFSAPGTYAMNVRASGTATSYCPNVSVAATWCTAATTDLTITATPARVRSGQSTTLNWSATGVNGQNATCSVSGPGVSWTSAVTASPSCSASGTANTTISTQSVYTLTCAGASKSVTVNVIPNFQEF